MNPLFRQRLEQILKNRHESGTLRRIAVPPSGDTILNLADNDYLDLAHDPVVAAAARKAIDLLGCSASASPLITGYKEVHRELEEKLCRWHGMPCGLVWNSGFTANQAVLGRLPARGDLVMADRLIHNSMISGILRSGARLLRYRHNDIDHLQDLLRREAGRERPVFVVTETVFSMDGDAPDLAAMAELKRETPFIWIVDEAHATGWYGPSGAGLLEETGVTGEVDVVVGTLGKALGSMGAYTLFHDERLRAFLINEAAEFIYSTYLTPSAAGAASAAIDRCRELSLERHFRRESSAKFRRVLAGDGWSVPPGDSPVVPVLIGDPDATVALAHSLRKSNILISAVRSPTVPKGTDRLRISLKRSLGQDDFQRIRTAMKAAGKVDLKGSRL